jgi:hypothetical protein
MLYNKIKFLYNNILITREKKFDSLINILYWILNILTKIFQFIFVLRLFYLSKTLFSLYIIKIVFKFFLISLPNIKNFIKYFKNVFILIIIFIILCIENFCELPMHFFFSNNKIYLFTNYYKVYDLKTKFKYNFYTEFIFNIICEIFNFYYFFDGIYHYSAFFLIILNTINMIINFLFICYYCFTDEVNILKMEDEKIQQKRLNNNNNNNDNENINKKKLKNNIIKSEEEQLNNKIEIV